jgi:hypothetical protein
VRELTFQPFLPALRSPPAPAALQADDAAGLAGRIDDELEGVVEPVIDTLAALVGEAETDSEATVGERQLVDVEADGSRLLERMT